MFRYFKAFWYMLTGWFSKKTEKLQENKHVMAATFDKSIDKSEDRIKTVRDAITELIMVEQNIKNDVKMLGDDIEKLSKVKIGAQTAMQKRIDLLKSQNKSKEQILADFEFLKHKNAFDDASSTLTQKLDRMGDKEKMLQTRQGQLAQYKIQLQEMHRETEELKQEKHEAIADIEIAKQSEEINAALAQIPVDTTDNDLAAARKARQRAQARATVTAEMIGHDAKSTQAEYLNYAEEQQTSKELDTLLNWGDETPTKEEKLSPAKLPE